MTTPLPHEVSRPVLLLVHGAWLGAWSGRRCSPRLQRAAAPVAPRRGSTDLKPDSAGRDNARGCPCLGSAHLPASQRQDDGARRWGSDCRCDRFWCPPPVGVSLVCLSHLG